jgi:acetylornithine deacetylase/succinyl-diaminopimelate desuccinylase-like protein
MTSTSGPSTSDPARSTATAAEAEVVGICQDLIRIDTSNYGDGSGPGERAAAEHVMALLHEVGLEPELFESAPGRANVVVRLEGEDSSRPALVLHGHTDVVPAEAKDWKVDPFAGEEFDGMVWGRGAVDMKGMDAMILAVVRQMVYAVDERPDLFEGATEAISEVGGFSVDVDGRRAYLLQTAEKGIAWLRLVADGQAGHGSAVNPDNAVTELAGAVARIGAHQWDIRITPTVLALLEGVADLTGLPLDVDDPLAIDRLIGALGPARRFVGSSIRTLANPTQLHAGYKSNVIPSRATATIDVRPLPGDHEDVLAKVRELAGPHVRVEPEHLDIGLEVAHTGALVDTMTDVLRAQDPEAVVLPYMLSAGTDNKSLARLGITGYGFAPLRLPADLDFTALFHGVDERVPTDALRFGVRVLDGLLREA